MKSLCEWFTNGKKVAVGGCLLVLAAVITFLSKGDGNFGYIGYLIFVIAISCMWNSLISKWNSCNVNLFLYALLILLPTCVGIELSQYLESSILIGTIAICVVVVWLGSTLLIRTDQIFKRLVMGFVSTLLNAVTVAIGIVLIALITMPAS